MVDPPPPAAKPSDKFTEFFPYLTGHSGSATAIWRFTGQVLVTYTFKPFLVTWGAATEHWAITTCNGDPWVTILGYQDGNGPVWPAENVRTTWDGIEQHCTTGAPYAPVNLVPGVHTLTQWGTIAGARYFWQSEYTFGTSELNPCWTGSDPVRPVIVQREIWADAGGTVRGQINGDPWANDKPSPVQVYYDYRTAIGLGVGQLWHATSSQGEFCLQSITIQ